jgi:NTE family protein
MPGMTLMPRQDSSLLIQHESPIAAISWRAVISRRYVAGLAVALALGACGTVQPVSTSFPANASAIAPQKTPPADEHPVIPEGISKSGEPLEVPVQPAKPVRIALALGGGAARGFAHIGVIKVLEANGIQPDYIVGTSAGAVVGALYASGLNGFDLQQTAMRMDESVFADWVLGGRGMFRGEALQQWVNHEVGNKPIEQLKRTLGVTATDLSSGDMIVFRRGNTGTAVRASSSVPGVFTPVNIGGREYVDGGLVSPVPVRAARQMGADIVIAVDISSDPALQPTGSVTDLLMQTFTIMGRSINRFETAEADVLIQPRINARSTDFSARHAAMLAGEKAMTLKIAELKSKLEIARQSH